MSASEAARMDQAFYAEQDGDLWYVVGCQSGFAYTEHESKREAENAVLRKSKDNHA